MDDARALIDYGIQLGRQLEQAEHVQTLTRIEQKLDQILALEAQSMTAIEDVDAAVTAAEGRLTALTSVSEATTALLDEVAQLIRDHAGDPEALEALAARITAVNAGTEGVEQSLASATLRNTDVDPTPPTP